MIGETTTGSKRLSPTGRLPIVQMALVITIAPTSTGSATESAPLESTPDPLVPVFPSNNDPGGKRLVPERNHPLPPLRHRHILPS